jgi:predicted nucleic acid-binding protein
MIFADLPAGASVFLDANTLVYHFGPHPVFGPACNQLLQRIENGEIAGITSTPVLSELAHRLMTFEASALFGWPSKVVDRLKQNPSAVGQLTHCRQAVAKVPQLNIKVLIIPETLVETAAAVSQQTGLLSKDALIVAIMQAHGLTNLASHDADFDRVPGLTRYGPV